jgi:hypothetical protein
MDNATLSMQVSATEPGLDVLVRLNNIDIFQGTPGVDPVIIKHEFDDSDIEYTLCIELSGKTTDHTKVDENGNIIKDVLVRVSDVKLEDIDVSQIMFQKAEYHHSFNGTQNKIVDSFHGIMGCNGQVIFKFQAPVYLWLLDNM